MRNSCSGIRLAGIIKLLPLQGDRLAHIIPRAMPWARGFCPFRACGQNLRKFSYLTNNDVNFIQIFGVIKILQYICIQRI